METRINKYISETGICSRREADRLIEEGKVSIDGVKAEMGSKVLPGQVVKVNGQVLHHQVEPVTIVYNKPVGVVSTTDPAEPHNIVEAVGHPERIFPIGRLDKDSQGLILLTNEGDMVNKILREGNNHDKEYMVTVDKPISEDFVRRMQGGVPILGVVTKRCEVVRHSNYVFSIVLRQGLNRQIRRMCEYLGYEVRKLERIRVMHIHLGKLKPGQWRPLSPAEMQELNKRLAHSIKTEEASIGQGAPKRPKPNPTPPHSGKRPGQDTRGARPGKPGKRPHRP